MQRVILFFIALLSLSAAATIKRVIRSHDRPPPPYHHGPRYSGNTGYKYGSHYGTYYGPRMHFQYVHHALDYNANIVTQMEGVQH